MHKIIRAVSHTINSVQVDKCSNGIYIYIHTVVYMYIHALMRLYKIVAYAYMYHFAYCAGSCDVYVQSTIKWRRSKRKSPRWTWILLSEGQTLPYYTKGTSRTKIRPSHIKIMVFRPLIWTVERTLGVFR